MAFTIELFLFVITMAIASYYVGYVKGDARRARAGGSKEKHAVLNELAALAKRNGYFISIAAALFGALLLDRIAFYFSVFNQ